MAELMNALDSTSTRPYLVRALYEWCTDNGLTPYVAVAVDETVQVPREYVKNNEIVLNISFDATSSLKLGNDFIEFKARFAGSARDIMVPIGRVIAIYARENGQGMAFPLASTLDSGSPDVKSAVGGIPITPSSAVSAVPSLTVATGQVVAAADSKIIQLVPVEGHASSGDGDLEPPDPPKPKQTGRPSLKRVK